ncbi:hypothetical protein Tco_1076221, partial [Tanacetum coccineum]
VKSSIARRRARIVVSDDEDYLEDPSKQGRKIAKIDQDPDISLVQHDANIQGRYEHDIEFKSDFDAAKEVSTAEKDVGTAEQVSTVGTVVTTASVTANPTRNNGVSTADDITMAETLVFIRKIAARDKAALRLQAKLEEEERHRIARVHEVAISFNVEEWEDIQARVEADEELAHRLQAEEKKKYTEAEQARMLVELINQRKRYFATKIVEERRNKPPTQGQQRTYMSNYFKNMGDYTLQQLRGYYFDEIKTLFETTMRRVNTFVPIESEVDRAVADSELVEEPRDKEADELSQEELQQMMIIVPKKWMNCIIVSTGEGNRHLYAWLMMESIVKRNSHIDVGCKALSGTR